MAISKSNWNKIRSCIHELVVSDNYFANINEEVINEAFNSPCMQRWIQPYIIKRGLEWTYEAFSSFYEETINGFINSGIIAEDELMPMNSGMAI